jgi:hypothetical protein
VNAGRDYRVEYGNNIAPDSLGAILAPESDLTGYPAPRKYKMRAPTITARHAGDVYCR